MKKNLCIVAISVSAALCVSAATNYVDCVNGVDDTLHGSSETNAYATIQYAVDKASANDTIIVLPGVYSSGGFAPQFSRVNITKTLRLESRDGRDKTFIVGSQAEYDGSSATPYAACWRCVRVTSGAAGTVVKGFTLTGGGQTEGGGANFSGASYLVDCVCSNNIATRGAAVMNGTIIRCLITENTCGGGATRGTAHYTSVITRNYGGNMCSYPKKIANCTIIENYDTAAAYAAVRYDDSNLVYPIYNTLFLYNRSDCDSGKVWTNCVTSVKVAVGNVCSAKSGNVTSNVVASAQLVAPSLNDWRPLAGSATATAGLADWLSEVTVPEEFRYVDYYGYPIPKSGVIAAGAAQETVTPQGGSLLLDGKFKKPDGQEMLMSGMAIWSEQWPTQFRVRAESTSPIFCYSSSRGYPDYLFPEKDGSLLVMPPPEGERTITPVFAGNVYYVNKATGNDSYDGSSAERGEGDAGPKRTIQGAVDAAPSGASRNCSVIYVAPGDYDEGGAFMYGVSNRVCVTNKSVRIVATGTAAETIIRGAPDKNAAESAFGCGPGAVRCVAFYEIRNAIQGFTLTDGHSDLYTGSSFGKSGGAFYTQQERPSVISDCIISNNVGQNAAAGNSGWFIRCKVSCNRILEKGNCIFNNSTLSSCLLGTNIFGKATAGVVCGSASVFARAWHCTLLGLGENERSGAAFSSGPLFANSIAVDFYNTDQNVTFTGCVCNAYYDYYSSMVEGFEHADPLFKDKAAGDFRLLCTSPAIGAGRADVTDYWKWATSDIDSNPIQFTDGRPTAGACQKPLLVVRAAGRLVSPSGVSVLEPGEELTLSIGGSSRKVEGWVVNGTTNFTAEAAWRVIALDRAYGAQDALEIEPLCRPCGIRLIVR